MDDNASIPSDSTAMNDQKLAVRAICITFPILATIVTFLRFESRRLKRARIWWDDYLALVGLILSIGVAIDVLICSIAGNLGGHERVDDQGNPINTVTYAVFGKTVYTLELILWPAVGVTKVSVLMLYARIFVGRHLRQAIWVSVGVVIACAVAFEFALAFTCSPVASFWDTSLPYTCVDQSALITAALTTDVLTDAFILCLPIRTIWRLQAPVRTKVIVFFMFLLGGLVTVTGIIRLHYLQDAYVALDDPNYNDETYVYTRPIYWSVIESSTGIISACLPTIKPVWRGYHLDSVLPAIVKTFTGRSNNTTATRSVVNPASRSGQVLPTAESIVLTEDVSGTNMKCSDISCHLEVEDEASPHDLENHISKNGQTIA